MIGSLGLEPRDEDAGLPKELQGREIGYVLSRDYWGRGLMPEAVKAVIDYCFQELSFDYLTCGHFDRNDRSRRVVEKSGFRFLKMWSRPPHGVLTSQGRCTSCTTR